MVRKYAPMLFMLAGNLIFAGAPQVAGQTWPTIPASTIEITCGTGIRISGITIYDVSPEYLYVVDRGEVRSIFIKWINEIRVPIVRPENECSKLVRFKQRIHEWKPWLFDKTFVATHRVGFLTPTEKAEILRRLFPAMG
ncbi:MAG: hypothetical protein ABIA75_05905 [Candidatus Neomarinimicrobiota bacterium]